jgi:hypothetical protein
VERGKVIYMVGCASCHGYQDGKAYVFEGEGIGQVEPIANLGTDRARLDSYTEAFRAQQLEKLFAGTRYQFKNFKKTDGYANLPLDGIMVNSRWGTQEAASDPSKFQQANAHFVLPGYFQGLFMGISIGVMACIRFFGVVEPGAG